METAELLKNFALKYTESSADVGAVNGKVRSSAPATMKAGVVRDRVRIACLLEARSHRTRHVGPRMEIAQNVAGTPHRRSWRLLCRPAGGTGWTHAEGGRAGGGCGVRRC